jgi:hypothetical protein
VALRQEAGGAAVFIRHVARSLIEPERISLEIVQQVGKIVESVPFIEPIGAILSALVDVYKVGNFPNSVIRMYNIPTGSQRNVREKGSTR